MSYLRRMRSILVYTIYNIIVHDYCTHHIVKGVWFGILEYIIYYLQNTFTYIMYLYRYLNK